VTKKPVPPPASLGPAGNDLWCRLNRPYSFLDYGLTALSNWCAALDEVARLARLQSEHGVAIDVSPEQDRLSAVLPPLVAARLADARWCGLQQRRDAPLQRVEAAA
jgi:hypothetical protein